MYYLHELISMIVDALHLLSQKFGNLTEHQCTLSCSCVILVSFLGYIFMWPFCVLCMIYSKINFSTTLDCYSLTKLYGCSASHFHYNLGTIWHNTFFFLVISVYASLEEDVMLVCAHLGV